MDMSGCHFANGCRGKRVCIKSISRLPTAKCFNRSWHFIDLADRRADSKPRDGGSALPEQITNCVDPAHFALALPFMAGNSSNTTKRAALWRAHQRRCAHPGRLPPRFCSAGLIGKNGMDLWQAYETSSD